MDHEKAISRLVFRLMDRNLFLSDPSVVFHSFHATSSTHPPQLRNDVERNHGSTTAVVVGRPSGVKPGTNSMTVFPPVPS
jgi:hypothetical protein